MDRKVNPDRCAPEALHRQTGSVDPHRSRTRALTIALAANGVFLVAEVVGGVVFNSLALLADAAHMASDVAALLVALVAQRLAARPATAAHTFGLQRAEVLGAQANAVLLFAASGWIVYEAIQRLDDGLAGTLEVAGGGLLVVATGGLLVNVASAVVLHRAAGHSLNMRGAFLHMSLDAVGSVGAVATGIVIIVWGTAWVDPVVSVLIAALVVWSAVGLVRQTTRVLMEGTPKHLDAGEIERFLVADPAVEDVHHLHVWNLASDVPALSAHVVLEGEDVSLHDAQEQGDRLRAIVLERFGIDHITFELECHGCEPPASRGPTRR